MKKHCKVCGALITESLVEDKAIHFICRNCNMIEEVVIAEIQDVIEHLDPMVDIKQMMEMQLLFSQAILSIVESWQVRFAQLERKAEYYRKKADFYEAKVNNASNT